MCLLYTNKDTLICVRFILYCNFMNKTIFTIDEIVGENSFLVLYMCDVISQF